jgi:hypothetical protein
MVRSGREALKASSSASEMGWWVKLLYIRILTVEALVRGSATVLMRCGSMKIALTSLWTRVCSTPLVDRVS